MKLTTSGEPANPRLAGLRVRLRREARGARHHRSADRFPQRRGGASWAAFGPSVIENDTVAHIGELLRAAKSADITVAVSPHYFYPTDEQWTFGDPLEQFMSSVGMFARQGGRTPSTGSPARARTSCPHTTAISTTDEP